MGTRVTAVLGTLLLAIVLAAGCSDGDDDEARDSSEDAEANESSDADESTDRQDDGDVETTDDGGPPDDASGDLVDPSEIDVPEGSDPEVRQEYIDAIVATAETSESSGFGPEAAECIATAFVDAAGTDALQAAGVTPQELAEAEESPADMGLEFPEGAGDVFYEEASSCMDLRSLILASLEGQEDTAMRDCIDDAVDDEMIKEYFVAVFIGGADDTDAEFDAIDEAVEPCLSTE